MDVPCSIQGNIHAFSLIINVSRILGTYHFRPALFMSSLTLPLQSMVRKSKRSRALRTTPSVVSRNLADSIVIVMGVCIKTN